MTLNKYLPSKEFKRRVIKIALLLGLVVVLRFGAYPLVKKLFDKNTIPENITVKQFVDTDTDGDGLADWEESIWGTDPKKIDTDNDGISDFDHVAVKKQGLSGADQNETTILSAEIMQTLFALMGKDAVTSEAIANLGDAAGQSIIKPEIIDTYTANDIIIVGSSKPEVKSYYANFQKILKTFSTSKAPDEFTTLSIAISSEDESQLVDLDQTIKKYEVFEKNLLTMKVPSDVLQAHLGITNSIASISKALTKSQKLYSNSIVGINGIVEMRLAHTKLDEQINLLRSYFLRNDLIN